MKSFFIIIVVLYSLAAYSQNKTIDSLKKILQTQKEDTNKVNILNELCDQLILANDFKPVSQWATETLLLSERLNFKSGVAKAYVSIASVFSVQGDYTEALKNFFYALQVSQEINDDQGVTKTYLRIARAYSFQDNPPSAFKYYFLYLKAAEALKDTAAIITAHSEIGREYVYQEDFPNAVKQFDMVLQHAKKITSKFNISSVYTDMVGAYRQMGDYQKAFKSASTSLKIHTEMNDLRYIAFDYLNIGFIYEDLGEASFASGNIKKARNNYSNALANYFEFENHYPINDTTATDKGNLSSIYANIGNVYIKLGNLVKAREYFDRSIVYSKEIGWWDNLKNSYSGLYRLDSAEGNYEQAFENYRLFIQYRDSSTNKTNLAKVEAARVQYEFDKKEDQIKLLSTENELKSVIAAKESQKKNFAYATIAFVLITSGYGFYRYRRRRRLQSEKEMLNERLRISRELHDDMGSTLGSISIYSEVAKNRSAKNENTDEVIVKIGAASRELIDKMSDIVWSINPNNESIEQLQNRMQAFAAMMLTPHNIQYNFQADEAIKKLKLSAEERKNIFLIFKEAIHNIVKYAACSNVEIRLSLNDNHLEMQVKDDGKGFDITKLQEADSLGGNGIKNMKARAESMHAGFKVNSEINNGTIIELSVTLN
jgi:two-component system sensor histidine kinase UhpB